MLAFTAGCKRGEPLAATVNGEPITLAAFHKYLEVKPQVQVIVNPTGLQSGPSGIPQQPYVGSVVGSMGFQALNDLIQQVLLKQLSIDEGVYPSDSEISADLEEKKKSNPSYVRDLAGAGFTNDMIHNDIALQLASYKLTTRGIVVSEAEVAKYISEHPNEFIVPEGVDLTWMLVPDDRTRDAADADLNAGTPFINVATKFSVAPNARASSFIFPEHYVPRLSNYGPELMGEIKKTAELKQTKWIRFTEGWAKFYVNRKRPSQKLTVDSDMKKRVLKAISMQKGSQGKDVNQRVQDRLRVAKVEIMVEQLKDPWKQSIDRMQSLAASDSAGRGK